MLFIIFVSVLTSCGESYVETPVIKDPNSPMLYEDILTENILNEDHILEEFLYEIYLEEKQIVEDVIEETLLQEDRIEEVILLETYYLPPEDPYRYYDGATGQSIFGDEIDIDSLVKKTAIGAGVILTVAVIAVVDFYSPISVGIITSAANALPYAIKGAAAGTIIGAGVGATLGATSSLDKSERLTALTKLGLSTAALITTIIFPPLGGTAFATIGAITAITASSIGLITSGINAYEVFTRTEEMDIDLQNLDWNELGYSIAQKAIGGAADGFMIGAISGAVLGVLKSFHKVNGKLVLVDNSTFDPYYIDDLGRSNIERMSSGLAPIGYDGYSVEIHHMDQTDTGAVVEMQRTVHKSNYDKIHSNTGQYPSEINRPEFNKWRNLYWKWRSSLYGNWQIKKYFK